MTASEVPEFNFEVPRGYYWLIDHELVDFVPNSSLQPWHYLPGRHVIDLKERWPTGPSRTRLVAFAKRQDSDDLACFEVVGERANRVMLVHGWTETGYSVVTSFVGFWEWLKSVVDDIAEWVDFIDPDG